MPITLISIAIVHHTIGKLPQRRADLYEHCVQALCHRWDQARGVVRDGRWSTLEGHDKVAVLQQIALALHVQGDGARCIERGPLLDVIHAHLPDGVRPKTPQACAEWLEEMAERSGLLIPDGERAWRFRHHTFQEYLAARCICDTDRQATTTLAARLGDGYWREVVRLALGYRAISSSAAALEMVEGLAKAADGLREADDRVAAHAVLAAGLVDLRAYRLQGLEAAAEALKPTWRTMIEDEAQPGALPDRVSVGDALGWFGDPRLGWADDEHLVLVPAGPFCMGGVDPQAHDDEKPVRRKRHVGDFRIGRYPVTTADFLEFLRAPDLDDPGLWSHGDERGDFRSEMVQYLERRAPNHPAVGATWFEAQAFCAWLNRHRPRRDRWRWALPTEAQWEKAARGGALLRGGEPNPMPRRVYPWGDEWSAHRANGRSGHGRRTTPVGLFPAGRGPYKLLDQAGNVWEWCANAFVRYAAAEHLLPDTGRRMLRGGGWDLGAAYLRVSYRLIASPHYRFTAVGFRCVAVPPPNS